MNVLKAAQAANVKRVVITGLALSTHGFSWQNRTYSGSDWLESSELKSTHEKAKLAAEKAAWEFWQEQRQATPDKCFELVSILPVWILGPILSANSTSSVVNFSRVFYETVDKVENTPCAICDVRDVALALVRASQSESVAGERILIASKQELVSTLEWTEILRTAGYKLATVDKKRTSSSSSFHENCRLNNEKMKLVLGVEPIDLRKTLIDMAESLIRFNIVRVEMNGL